MRDLNELLKPGTFGEGSYADTRREEFDIKNGTLFYHEIPVDICFIGDSITHFWELNAFFHQYGLVINRGIGGDVAQIAAKRFAADVLQLKPRVCVVLVGINNMWPLKEIEDKNSQEFWSKEKEIYDLIINSYVNIMDQAKEASQALIFCNILPCAWPPEVNNLIFKVNARLAELCQEYEIPLVDYHTHIMGADEFSINWEYTGDGIHPNRAGYSVMASLLKPELDKVLGPIAAGK